MITYTITFEEKPDGTLYCNMSAPAEPKATFKEVMFATHFSEHFHTIFKKVAEGTKGFVFTQN
jgi:hypothetical protein